MIDLNNKISEIVYIIQPIEDKFCKENLDEIVDLVKSAGAEVYGYKTQVIKSVTPATYIGIVNKKLLVRRITISACNLQDESVRKQNNAPIQMTLFVDYDELEKQEQIREAAYEREKQRQNAIIDIRKKFGKNAILKGMNFEEGATTIDRNLQIGGHKA